VDLLTTGIDVPEICNLVFLRRVNSRILYEQMLGRATRRCDHIGKETFRVFDAVGIYAALASMTTMGAVVTDPSISFTQLARELTEVSTPEALTLIRDQFVAKLQRKKHRLADSAREDFEAVAGMAPDAFVKKLRAMSVAEVADWFVKNPGLGEILDRVSDKPSSPVLISDHKDKLRDAKPYFGKSGKPEDYIEPFKEYINSKGNQIPAILTVIKCPQELTRAQLRLLILELDKAGFSETNLNTAWRQMKNEEMAATIIGYIRQAAIGDPLIPFDQRVDAALKSMLASKNWTQSQREWLKKLAAQTKANRIVDRAALDEDHLIFKREGGGFNRLDKLFDGHLDQVLKHFNDSVWPQAQ